MRYKRRASVQLQNLEFSIETVLDHEECLSVFEKYLESTHTVEPLRFMQEVEKYRVKKSAKNRYIHAQYIIQMYIVPSSKCEINISNTHRQQILQDMERAGEKECPLQLFETAYSQIFLELKEDRFPKFVASEIFMRFCKSKMNKMGEEYFKFLATKKSSSQWENEIQSEESDVSSEASSECYYSTDDMDMQSVQITDFHFEYIKKELSWDRGNEESWEKIRKNGKLEVWISKRSHSLTKGSTRKMRKFKDMSEIPFSAEELMYAMIDRDTMNFVEDLFDDFKTISYYRSDLTRYSSAVYQTTFKLPFPFANRDNVCAHSLRRESDGSYLFIKKSTSHPKTRKYIRSELIGGWIIEPLGENKCRLRSTYLCDFHGWMPLSMWHVLLSARGDSFYEGLVKACQARREKYGEAAKTLPPTDSLGVYETLSEFLHNSERKESMRISSSSYTSTESTDIY